MIEEFWIPTPRGQLYSCRWRPAKAGFASDKPIILLHDSLGCIALWRDFPERLSVATGREVIAYDRLGFGQSDPHPDRLTPPDFIADEALGDFSYVIDHLSLGQFLVLGHSVGGGMGIGVAAKFPINCDGLVTISAQTFLEDRTLQGVREAQETFAAPKQIERLEKYHGKKTKWILDAWIENWLSPAFEDWSLNGLIGGVICPILAIHGADDEYGSRAHADRIMKRGFTPVTLLILEGEGHVPHKTSTNSVLESVSDFLKSL